MVADKVIVPAEVYDQLRELAGDRVGNVPDYRTMKERANRHGTRMIEHWLHNNMKLYEQIRLAGMAPANENQEPAENLVVSEIRADNSGIITHTDHPHEKGAGKK